uniref:Thyroid transcription factor 1like [Bombyx mori] n=1 Tax=Lepeophtheirus salmonis TaxID=72036 RepID=A0A0K2V2J1_LEPSM
MSEHSPNHSSQNSPRRVAVPVLVKDGKSLGHSDPESHSVESSHLGQAAPLNHHQLHHHLQQQIPHSHHHHHHVHHVHSGSGSSSHVPPPTPSSHHGQHPVKSEYGLSHPGGGGGVLLPAPSDDCQTHLPTLMHMGYSGATAAAVNNQRMQDSPGPSAYLGHGRVAW